MSLSINGNNRTFVRTNATKDASPKEIVQPEKQTTKSQAPAVAPHVITAQVNSETLLANRGVQVHNADPVSTKPQVNEMMILIDNQELFDKFMRGELNLKAGDSVYVNFNGMDIQYDINEDGSMTARNNNQPSDVAAQKGSTGIVNNVQTPIVGGKVNTPSPSVRADQVVGLEDGKPTTYDAEYYFESMDEFRDRLEDFRALFKAGDTITIQLEDSCCIQFEVREDGKFTLHNIG